MIAAPEAPPAAVPPETAGTFGELQRRREARRAAA